MPTSKALVTAKAIVQELSAVPTRESQRLPCQRDQPAHHCLQTVMFWLVLQDTELHKGQYHTTLVAHSCFK